jgi:hypothetical protein
MHLFHIFNKNGIIALKIESLFNLHLVYYN